MREDTPREPIRETPAPDGPPPSGVPRHYETHAPRLDRDRSNAGAFGRGILVASLVAAAFAMIEALVTVPLLMSGSRENITLGIRVGLLVLAVGFGVAVVVSKHLPRAARPSFWAMGAVCVACALIFLVGMKALGIGG